MSCTVLSVIQCLELNLASSKGTQELGQVFALCCVIQGEFSVLCTFSRFPVLILQESSNHHQY